MVAGVELVDFEFESPEVLEDDFSDADAPAESEDLAELSVELFADSRLSVR